MALAISGSKPGTQFADGPAFSAYQSSAQVFSAFTKIQCNVEEFDTMGAYDSAANYRFQPTVAGYYQINGAVTSGNSSCLCYAYIYKNGLQSRSGSFAGAAGTSCSVVSALIYLNGTTDYVELWGYQSVSQSNIAGPNPTYFQGFLARAA